MNKPSHAVAMSALLMLVFFVILNTILNLAGIYRGWFAVATYAVAIACCAITLRFQGRLPGAALAALLATPFVVSALVALSRG